MQQAAEEKMSLREWCTYISALPDSIGLYHLEAMKENSHGPG